MELHREGSARSLQSMLFGRLIKFVFAGPGKAKCCSTNTVVINSSINELSPPFPPLTSQNRNALTVRDMATNHILDYVKQV